MTWTDPTTRQTGDLITAAIWNQDVVDNTQALYDRIAFLPIEQYSYSNTLGDFKGCTLDGGQDAYWWFRVPDDFVSLVEAKGLVNVGSGTCQYDLTSDYYNPDADEAYNNHSQSSTNQTVSTTADHPKAIDLSGVLSSLAAGDVVGIKLHMDSAPGGASDNVGLGGWIAYTR